MRIAAAAVKKPRKAMPLEAPIMRAIEAAVNASGWAAVWRSNTGAVRAEYKGRTRFVRYGQVGSADLTGLVAGTGQRLEVECKRPGGKPTPAQIAYGETIRRYGGIYVVAVGVEDALDQIEREIKQAQARR